MATIIQREQLELQRREKIYRGGPLELGARAAVVVDDGLATGFTSERRCRLFAATDDHEVLACLARTRRAGEPRIAPVRQGRR